MLSKVSYFQVPNVPSRLPSEKKRKGAPGLEHPRNKAQRTLSLTSALAYRIQAGPITRLARYTQMMAVWLITEWKPSFA